MTRLSKHIEITDDLAQYVEELHAKAQDQTILSELDKTWDKSDFFLQIPLSEAKFLSLFVKAVKAKRVLEVGTFRGWSAGWIAGVLSQDGNLVTIDHDARIEKDAKELWEKIGVGEKIEFMLDKALSALHSLKEKGEKFDLIFIDARKTEYKEYLDISYELLNDGGTILVDNTLWPARHAVDGKSMAGGAGQELDKPRAKYLKDFNDYAFTRFAGSTCLIPAWDGVVMVVK